MMLKEDCYWYYEERDMGARLPFCKLKKGCNPIEPEDCADCEKYHSRYTRTKADRIRSMSDEELAKFLSDICYKNQNKDWCHFKCSTNCEDWDEMKCDDCILKWLRN